MPNGTKYYHLLVTALTQHPQQMTWRVHSSSSMVEIHWKDVQDYLVLVTSGIWVMTKDSSSAKLCKLWLSHAKSLQENRSLKTETLE